MLDALRRLVKHVTGNDYVVVDKGDSLWGIADAATGNGNRWRELVEANPGKHWDDKHTVIHPGEHIYLPDSWL